MIVLGWNTGSAYYDGRGVKQDLAKAISWFEEAAAQNHPDAFFMLGVCYQHSNAPLSERHFERARSAVWSMPFTRVSPLVAALGVSEHFSTLRSGII